MSDIFFLNKGDVERADAIVQMKKLVEDLLNAYRDLGFNDEQAHDLVVSMFRMSAEGSGGEENDKNIL